MVEVDVGTVAGSGRARPNLCFNSISTFTLKDFDVQMLLNPLEERFNLPPVFIDQCDLSGLDFKVIGYKTKVLSRS